MHVWTITALPLSLGLFSCYILFIKTSNMIFVVNCFDTHLESYIKTLVIANLN